MIKNTCNFILENFKNTPETRQKAHKALEKAFMGNVEVIPEPWPVKAGQALGHKVALLFLPTLFSLLSAASFDPAHLKKNAELQGLGYKTANLIELESLASAINLAMTPYFVTVPAFVGVSNTTIQYFLKVNGLDLVTQWQTMLAQTVGPNQRQKMLKRKQLNQKFRTELDQLREHITKIFNTSSLLNFARLQEFVTTAKQSEWSLMVRSTGKEDTDALANAGGNTSVANVPANPRHIMQAIGEVLASYLSVKSIQQRLQAGDASVFDTPFLPVLIQRMIGEPIGGAKNPSSIPTGCVLYTTETDGFTPGVALAQSTFGHNEGVVQSSMPIDTYYLCPNITYASIKRKTKRLIPALENLHYTLAEVANPSIVTDAPSLKSQSLRSLNIIAQVVEKFYGRPMDLELVVMPHEQTIYLVQARPIVMPRGKSIARYINDLSLFKSSQQIACTIINSNQGVLLEKVRANNIIMAKTLEKALAEFNELSDTKDEIQLIAVEDEAEITSHAAAVFRGEGKVIIRLPNGLKPLEEIITQPRATIAVSTQQGIILNLSGQAALTKKQIAIGLTSHPANIALSIVDNVSMWPSLSQFSLGSEKRDDVMALWQALQKDFTSSKLLKKLCYAVGQDGIAISNTKLRTASKPHHQEIKKKRHALQQFIGLIGDEIKTSKNKEQLMLHKRMLELAMTQKPNQSYINSMSHQSLEAEELATNKFLNEVIAPALQAGAISDAAIHNPTILCLAQDGYNRCLTSGVQKIWFTFLSMHAANQHIPNHLRVATLLKQLRQDDLLAGWLNTSLVQTMSQHIALKTNKLTNLQSHDLYNKIATAFVHEFESAQAQLTTINNILNTIMSIQPNEWESPKKFATLFARFNRDIVAQYNTPAFDDLLELCGNIDNNVLKLGVITALKKITDRYDLFIKAIKGSTEYPNKPLKIEHFHTMLKGYTMLLEKICDNEDFIAAVKERLDDYDEDDEDELVVSPHFNVNVIVQQNEQGATFNQRKFFDYMTSLEDIFTSTHQVLLSEISKKIVAWDITKSIDKPSLVAATEEVLEITDQLTGIRFEGTNVIFTYNRKLRAHSIQIEVCYDCATEQITLSYHFYGFNEFLRWNLIKDYISAISPKLEINLARIISRDYGLSIYWQVSNAKSVQALDDLLEDAIDITFELSIENRRTIFENIETILDTLFDKCATLYGSQDAFIKQLAESASDSGMNLLVLPALDDIAILNKKAAQTIFKQGLKIVGQILEGENHDSLVTAHYILADIVSAVEEINDDLERPSLPKRNRMSNYKTYHKVITNLHAAVKELVQKVEQEAA